MALWIWRDSVSLLSTALFHLNVIHSNFLNSVLRKHLHINTPTFCPQSPSWRLHAEFQDLASPFVSKYCLWLDGCIGRRLAGRYLGRWVGGGIICWPPKLHWRCQSSSSNSKQPQILTKSCLDCRLCRIWLSQNGATDYEVMYVEYPFISLPRVKCS